MSKFNKSALVGAIALAISGAAFAAGDVTLPGDAGDYVFAWELTAGDDVTANTSSINYAIKTPDILIGRTSDTGQVTVFATITGAELGTELVEDDIAVSQGTLDSVSSAPGGSTFQFVITPPAPETDGFTAASLFSIATLNLQAADSLATEGGQVTIAFEVKDTTTGTSLSSAPAKSVLTSQTATETEIDSGDTNIIDVMADKMLFVDDEDEIELGNVYIDRADVVASEEGDQVASADGAESTGNIGEGGEFIYDTANDTVDFTLMVPNAAAFDSLWVSNTPWCGEGTTTELEVDEDDATLFTGSAAIANPEGGMYTVCGLVDGETEIAAQTIGLTVQIDLDHESTNDPAAVTDPSFNILRYNGAVEKVWHFNPATNQNQTSYLRITNTSGTDGLVEIDSICDDGTAAPGTAEFMLEAGHSVLLTSPDVVTGNTNKGVSGGVGECAVGGKHRLTITGQFATMQVQNFLRNYTSVGQINTNVENDGDDDGTLDEFVKPYLDEFNND